MGGNEKKYNTKINGKQNNKRIQAQYNTTSIVFNGKREKQKKYRHGKDADQYDMEQCDIWAFGIRPKTMFVIWNDVLPNVTE